jgi:hypothetical protein
MKNCTVYFEVEMWFDGDIRTECGFIPANSFAEAVKEIEEYFGDDLASFNRLEMLESGLVLMEKDVARRVREYNF